MSPDVSVAAFRPIVERWLAQFEDMEEGFQILAARGDLTADAWRRRFTEDEGRWWASATAAAYRLYREGLSVMDIASLVYERFGFSRPVACRNSLTIAFRKEGWRLRDRREQQFAWRQRRAA